MAKKGIKSRCGGCGKPMHLSDGKRIKPGKKMPCPHCGHENTVGMKKNGKIRIV